MDQWVRIIQQLKNSKPSIQPEIKSGDVRCGFLIKRGRSNNLWKKRYFTLSNHGLLSYYRSEQDESPVGVIPLEGCSVNIGDKSLKRKFLFVVCTRYRNYFLEAADQFEMAGWIESIRFHSEKHEDKDSTTSGENIALFNRLNSLLTQHEKESEKTTEQDN